MSLCCRTGKLQDGREMDKHERRLIRVPIINGKLVTVRAQEKRRESEDGVDGFILAILHPQTFAEILEYWVPAESWAAV